MRRVVALMGMAFFCAQVAADEIDVGLNADAFRVMYMHEFRSNSLQLDGGWMYHSDNGSVVHVGLNLSDVASNTKELVAGLGGRLAYQDGEASGQSGFAVPIGGFLYFTPQKYNRITFGVAAYFAPDVLSTGDSTKYQDYTLRLAYNVMRQADIYVGARYVKGEYKNAPDVYYDTGMHIGFTLKF
jgi:hypothetical protein